MNPRTTISRLRHRFSAPERVLDRRLLAGLSSPIFVLMVAVCAFIAFSKIGASKHRVERTLHVIEAVHGVRTTLLDAQVGPSEELVAARATAAIHRLRALTADNREQQARVDVLERAVADALVPLGAGQHATENTRRMLEELLQAEVDLLWMREEEQERNLQISSFAIGGGSLMAFVLGLAVNRGIRKSVLEARHNQALIAGQALRLEATNRALDEHVHRLMVAKADLERALAERSSAVKALENANHELDQFAYAASHDLKAPLRGIANLAEWLEEDLVQVMTGKSQEHLRLLQGRVHRLEALIDGILAYARASRPRDKLESIRVAALLREVVELLAPPPGVVSIEHPEAMPMILAQRIPFQQVWMNLVVNALKHAGGAGAAIRLAAKDVGDAWEFSVSDNGPGIAPRFHARIFRMFQTLSARDKLEGTGIGLAIVKKLVDDQGGRVWVESEPGMGARFCFTWRKQ